MLTSPLSKQNREWDLRPSPQVTEQVVHVLQAVHEAQSWKYQIQKLRQIHIFFGQVDVNYCKTTFFKKLHT